MAVGPPVPGADIRGFPARRSIPRAGAAPAAQAAAGLRGRRRPPPCAAMPPSPAVASLLALLPSAAALLSLTLLLGGMAFFAAAVAPLVFTRLPPGQAGRFIRQVFPVYYLWVLGTAAAAAVALLPLRPWDALAAALIAAVTWWLRQRLMPRINALSDAARAGGDAAAGAGFARAHRLSVIANAVQMLAALGLLLRFA